MAIQRWDPLRDVMRLQETMNRLFEEAMGRFPTPAGDGDESPGTWRPPMDLIERADRYVVRADLPGMASGDVSVEVENGHLIVRGDRTDAADPSGNAYLRKERPSGRFSSRLHLPSSVDTQRIEAEQRNGVLEIVLPKRRADTRGSIEVAGG